MNDRLNLMEVQPESYRAMQALDRTVSAAGIEARTRHLLKVRASMINGCAFCIDMHTAAARHDGIPEAELFALAAWREAPCFSERERAALALTDAATRLAEGGVPDEVWDAAVEHFGLEGAAQLSFLIATINAWNRLVITNRTTPRSFQAKTR